MMMRWPRALLIHIRIEVWYGDRDDSPSPSLKVRSRPKPEAEALKAQTQGSGQVPRDNAAPIPQLSVQPSRVGAMQPCPRQLVRGG